MRNIFIGIFIGLVVATFAPKLADLSRNLFDAGRDLGGEVIETAREASD